MKRERGKKDGEMKRWKGKESEREGDSGERQGRKKSLRIEVCSQPGLGKD